VHSEAFRAIEQLGHRMAVWECFGSMRFTPDLLVRLPDGGLDHALAAVEMASDDAVIALLIPSIGATEQQHVLLVARSGGFCCAVVSTGNTLEWKTTARTQLLLTGDFKLRRTHPFHSRQCIHDFQNIGEFFELPHGAKLCDFLV
jgi:hypothetical protein